MRTTLSWCTLMIAVAMLLGCNRISTPDVGETVGRTDLGDVLNTDSDLPDYAAAKFSDPTNIDNPWFPLKPGTRLVWDGTSVDEEGDVEAHSVSFVVTDLTKEIDGVQTVVCWDRDLVDGELEEAEIVFFAQDDEGNVWHFGQYPEEYSDGVIEATPGWLHGVKDGRAGIHMTADPKLGDPSFAQGWSPSVPWTDRAIVWKVGESVAGPTGSYEDVLIFAESDQEEPDARQLKYYGRGVGCIKIGSLGGDQEDMELVKIEQLSDEELAEARAAALKLEASANENLKEIYGKSNPSQPTNAKEGTSE